MTAKARQPIPGTHRNVWPGATAAGDLTSNADVLLTAWLRGKTGGELDVERARLLGATLPAKRTYAERADLERQTTADPHDVELLQRYCKPFGIEIVASHWRSIVMRGALRSCVDAFGATAGVFEDSNKRRFRHRSESLHVPADIAPLLRGIFGIHQWPRSGRLGTVHAQTKPLSAAEVASRYHFPDADGSDQTVGILQLRGTFKAADFTKCMRAQGVSTRLPIVKRVDDAELVHGIETAKDAESAADTQIVAALAPGAQIVVYAAPDDERGVLDAIRTALFDRERRPTILSISFGFPEHVWTPAALTILDQLFTVAALLGVSIFCASGDNGAELDNDGKAHVLAPASSPFAHSCGGTEIEHDRESGWHQSGGGFSAHFDKPPWQNHAGPTTTVHRGVPGRGLPDVSAQVVPGYTVCLDGTVLAMGGTSAVAPMWSALAARLSQRIGTPIGFFAPLLYRYASRGLFADVTSGGNDRFTAARGWDPCTGLGVPNGANIEKALRQTTAKD